MSEQGQASPKMEEFTAVNKNGEPQANFTVPKIEEEVYQPDELAMRTFFVPSRTGDGKHGISATSQEEANNIDKQERGFDAALAVQNNIPKRPEDPTLAEEWVIEERKIIDTIKATGLPADITSSRISTWIYLLNEQQERDLNRQEKDEIKTFERYARLLFNNKTPVGKERIDRLKSLVPPRTLNQVRGFGPDTRQHASPKTSDGVWQQIEESVGIDQFNSFIPILNFMKDHLENGNLVEEVSAKLYLVTPNTQSKPSVLQEVPTESGFGTPHKKQAEPLPTPEEPEQLDPTVVAPQTPTSPSKETPKEELYQAAETSRKPSNESLEKARLREIKAENLARLIRQEAIGQLQGLEAATVKTHNSQGHVRLQSFAYGESIEKLRDESHGLQNRDMANLLDYPQAPGSGVIPREIPDPSDIEPDIRRKRKVEYTSVRQVQTLVIRPYELYQVVDNFGRILGKKPTEKLSPGEHVEPKSYITPSGRTIQAGEGWKEYTLHMPLQPSEYEHRNAYMNLQLLLPPKLWDNLDQERQEDSLIVDAVFRKLFPKEVATLNERVPRIPATHLYTIDQTTGQETLQEYSTPVL